MAREAARLSRLLIAREALLRKHPNMNAIIPGMFANTCGMFVFWLGCSWGGLTPYPSVQTMSAASTSPTLDRLNETI